MKNETQLQDQLFFESVKLFNCWVLDFLNNFKLNLIFEEKNLMSIYSIELIYKMCT